MRFLLRKECWKPVKGFPNYRVSTLGRVYSLNRMRFICQTYDRVTLCHIGKMFRPRVAVIVLEAFVGKRPKGKLACHKDDNTLNNRLDNLYWGTHSQNVKDAIRNGKHKGNSSKRSAESCERMIRAHNKHKTKREIDRIVRERRKLWVLQGRQFR